jgi:hypothetical protein
LNGERFSLLQDNFVAFLGVIRDNRKIAFSDAKSSIDRLEVEEFTGRV